MTLIQSLTGSCYFGSDPMQCVIDQLTAATGGEAMFGLITGSVLFLGFYVAADGEMAPPTVALILSGSVLVPMVPANYGRIAMGVVIIGLAGAVLQVLQKYVLSPTTQ